MYCLSIKEEVGHCKRHRKQDLNIKNTFRTVFERFNYIYSAIRLVSMVRFMQSLNLLPVLLNIKPLICSS